MKHRISWTEKTWNPTTGCTKIASGCKACYALRMHNRLRRMGQPKYQHDFSEVRCHPEVLAELDHWKKPRMVFVNSMSDLFHEDVPDEFIFDVFRKMTTGNRRHKYQILTKRPKRMMEWIIANQKRFWHHPDNLTEEYKRDYPDVRFPNDPCLWLGYSASTQKELDAGLPYLLKTPAAVRFLSLEPLLEYIEIEKYLLPFRCSECGATGYGDDQAFEFCAENTILPSGLNWVIVGAESKGAYPGRECKLELVRNIRDQCQATGVPLHIKQIHIDSKLVKDVAKFPVDLRIQQYPEVK